MSDTPEMNGMLHRATALDAAAAAALSGPQRDAEGRRVYWALAYDSTTTDLHGTRMTPDAFRGSAEQLDFPVLLFHNKASLPVAKPVATAYSDKGLNVGFVFAPTPEARLAEELVSGGFLRGVSVGFVPRDGFVDKADGATVFTRAELIELSLTPTPSSRKALVDLTRSIGADPDDLADMLDALAEDSTDRAEDDAEASADADAGTDAETVDDVRTADDVQGGTADDTAGEDVEVAADDVPCARQSAIDTLRALGVDEGILSLLGRDVTPAEGEGEKGDDDVDAGVDSDNGPKRAATVDGARERSLRNLELLRRHRRR